MSYSRRVQLSTKHGTLSPEPHFTGLWAPEEPNVYGNDIRG
jgi:hypothetical protein